MKIIATTRTGYLVEATDRELANVAGHASPVNTVGWAWLDSYHHQGEYKIGTEFKPTEAFIYLQKLRENEAKVKSSESMLRALADMLAGALPTTIVPPLIDDATSAGERTE